MQKRAIKINLSLLDDVANARKELASKTSEFTKLISDSESLLSEMQNPAPGIKNLRFIVKNIESLINKGDSISNRINQAFTEGLAIERKSREILNEVTKALPMMEKFGYDKSQIKGLISLQNEEKQFTNKVMNQLRKLNSSFADLL
jgi:hypothetical protein